MAQVAQEIDPSPYTLAGGVFIFRVLLDQCFRYGDKTSAVIRQCPTYLLGHLGLYHYFKQLQVAQMPAQGGPG